MRSNVVTRTLVTCKYDERVLKSKTYALLHRIDNRADEIDRSDGKATTWTLKANTKESLQPAVLNLLQLLN